MTTTRMGKAQEVLTVRSYEKLYRFIEAFSDGHLNLLILIGNPGLAKTRIVKDGLAGHSSCWIEGNATAFGIYQELYYNRDCDFVVIDDVDNLYSDRVGVRLLKGLCQTEDTKTVAWHSSARSLQREGVPAKFTMSAKVIIISNDWKTLNRNVVALQDRGFLLAFEPSAMEVHKRAGEFFQDTAVFEWFGENLHLIGEPSLRHYVRASMLKQAGMDWTEVLPLEQTNPKERLVAELLADQSFVTQEARVKEFIARRGGSRRTFFNYARRIKRE